MINQEEILYSLALSYTKGVGVITAKKLIEHFGSAKLVFEQKKTDLLLVFGVGAKELQNLPDSDSLLKAEREVNFCQKNSIKILHYQSSDYPTLLAECSDAPVALFQKGDYVWGSKKSISIVGTRKITAYGKEQTQKIVEDLADLPVAITSGLAYGVDITAHKKALEVKLPTLAVLGHGLHKIYPSEHQKYVAKILDQGGALLSEFSSFQNGDRNFFLQRNRIIAGLSMATLVVESDIKGGALSTAKFANNYNREVFAVPGRNGDTYSLGCNHLIKTNQAQLYTSTKDLDYYLNLDTKKEKTNQSALPIGLDENLEAIYLLLKKNGKMHIDELCIQLEKPSYLLLGELLELEMSGLIRNLPGKIFESV